MIEWDPRQRRGRSSIEATIKPQGYLLIARFFRRRESLEKLERLGLGPLVWLGVQDVALNFAILIFAVSFVVFAAKDNQRERKFWRRRASAPPIEDSIRQSTSER